jgi:adenylate kinase family enzyme
MINQTIEPTILHVRPNSKMVDLHNVIVDSLVKEGYVNLDLLEIAKGLQERGNMLGKLYKAQSAGERAVPAELIIQMLKSSIYCGQPKKDKFLLTNFPDQLEHVSVFEDTCCNITAMIYPTHNENEVEIKDEASIPTIESLFQKKYKLKPMKEWSMDKF